MVIQQNYRMGANDPQIQMAQDAASAISAGQNLSMVVPAGQVEISRSLAPYLIVYDDSGNVLASSALLDGQSPRLPAGVFDYVRQHGEDRITWQPREGVRQATVITRYAGNTSGFVLAGRSLREVEVRIDQSELMVGIAWALIIFSTVVIIVLIMWLEDKIVKR